MSLTPKLPRGTKTLLGRKWRLRPTGHVFKVHALMVSGNLEIEEGRTRRYVPGATLRAALRRGLLEEA